LNIIEYLFCEILFGKVLLIEKSAAEKVAGKLRKKSVAEKVWKEKCGRKIVVGKPWQKKCGRKSATEKSRQKHHDRKSAAEKSQQKTLMSWHIHEVYS
jgi:hypothetical protein